ncbi:MAG: DUF3592 domain-containing protein [Actinomycetia bacterium]|nr:DUF3592 domain-containing protein [Actinomycetes bacterium]
MWLVVGIALFSFFAVYVTRTDDHSAKLKASGAKVTATVLADQPASLNCAQVDVPVRFTVGGVVHNETLSVGGCGSNLRKNDQLTLYVNPAHPSDFVSDQSDNEGYWAVLAAVFAFVGGLALIVCAIVRGLRLPRTRRTLREAPWTERTAANLSVRGKIARVTLPILALTDVDPPRLLVLRFPTTQNINIVGPGVVVARSANNWTVVASNSSGPLRAAKAPSERVQRKALAALDT